MKKYGVSIFIIAVIIFVAIMANIAFDRMQFTLLSRIVLTVCMTDVVYVALSEVLR